MGPATDGYRIIDAGLNDSEAAAIANHRRTIKKLLAAGYDVDAKSDNIADWFLTG